MSLIPANNIEVQDEGTSQGRVRTINWVGAGVAATVSGSVATVTVSGGAGADIASSTLAPTTDETIAAANSAVLVRSYTIASGKKLTLGLAARFRIL